MTRSAYIEAKKTTQRTRATLTALAVLGALCVGYIWGNHNGTTKANFAAVADIENCLASGAQGWQVDARGVWCLYE